VTTGPTQAPRQPGLREQIDRTIAAARALFKAHQALLQAELAEIGGEIARIAAMVGGLIALVLFTGLLLTIGGALFLGEWLFGSIGWGIALGTLLCAGVAVTLALAVVAAPRRVMSGGFLIGLGVAVVAAAILAADLPRRIAQSLADGLGSGPGGLDPHWAPTIVGLVVVGVVLGVLGFALFARTGGMSAGIAGAVVGLVLGALVGGLLGGLTFSRHGGVAVGIAVGLLAWPIASAALLRGARFDPTARFRGLWPKESYDAAMATKTWLQQRWEERPGRRSTNA
jgi:hypothetical protein